ncbi:MAG: dihydrolipoamide acetyltransferase family protein [Sphingomonas sp.]|uniref:dihydrolipoamide acetyltransferase family protein n=1 Tax=Sphingomonas sp. TaxID=28214 RepID=UPI0022736430|nr:dihydrolipoamide acetyltransferase family protein [Sphingomonas sp.]MCX8474348.1 dihydrolipoamide acetyltransferase family protein [Sphingomonas sp.]
MARFTFRLPDIGEGIAEAEIVAWHVRVGERVEEDQQVADMMTDKATVEMESPVSGVVVALAGEVGDQVAIGSALMVVETDGDGAEGPAEEVIEAENPGVEEVAQPTVRAEPVEAPSSSSSEPQKEEQPFDKLRANGESVAAPHRHVLASPAVRARARDLGIDLASVKSDSDRVRHADLDAYLRYGQAQGYHAPHASRAREDVPVKVIGMRRRIAENMAASKRAIPHFTYVEEIDVTALEDMRGDLNANRGNRPKLTMLPFLIVAICRTIPAFPMINARYDDEAGLITRHGRVHLGMATQTDAGLMVPVIRDAQDRNVWQLASEIGRLAEAARTGKAKSEELSGSTLTVTSLGPLGGIATTPVINRPEVAIIGPNKIVERPIFVGDEIVRAKLMNLSISCDHRVVDGWDAASFVQALKKLLETPVLLFAD